VLPTPPIQAAHLPFPHPCQHYSLTLDSAGNMGMAMVVAKKKIILHAHLYTLPHITTRATYPSPLPSPTPTALTVSSHRRRVAAAPTHRSSLPRCGVLEQHRPRLILRYLYAPFFSRSLTHFRRLHLLSFAYVLLRLAGHCSARALPLPVYCCL